MNIGDEKGLFDTARSKGVRSDCEAKPSHIPAHIALQRPLCGWMSRKDVCQSRPCAAASKCEMPRKKQLRGSNHALIRIPAKQPASLQVLLVSSMGERGPECRLEQVWSFTNVNIGDEKGLFDTARSKGVRSDCEAKPSHIPAHIALQRPLCGWMSRKDVCQSRPCAAASKCEMPRKKQLRGSNHALIRIPAKQPASLQVLLVSSMGERGPECRLEQVWSFTNVNIGDEKGLFDTARSKGVRLGLDCKDVGGTIHVSSLLQKEALRITKVLVE